jgi:hypothetical protein
VSLRGGPMCYAAARADVAMAKLLLAKGAPVASAEQRCMAWMFGLTHTPAYVAKELHGSTWTLNPAYEFAYKSANPSAVDLLDFSLFLVKQGATAE